jgi:DNA-binding NarL/FixJ family response regulator
MSFRISGSGSGNNWSALKMTDGTKKEQTSPLGELTQTASIRVYLLIENRLLRESLVRIFRKYPDLHIVGQTGKTEAPDQNLDESRCDVLVVGMFDPRWLPQCVESESQVRLRCKSVLIGMSNDQEQFLAAVRHGISGYLLHDASASDVVAAVRAVFRGEAHCPPQLTLKLFQCVSQMAREAPLKGSTARLNLTLRQQKLVALVGNGLTNKEIASQLNLSEFTVRNHLHRIMRRLKAGNRREAVEAVRAHAAAARVVESGR